MSTISTSGILQTALADRQLELDYQRPASEETAGPQFESSLEARELNPTISDEFLCLLNAI